MNLSTKDIAELAVIYSTGLITEERIKEEYGDNVFSSIAAIACGGVIASVASSAISSTLDFVEDTEVGGMLKDCTNDLFDSVGDLFDF